MLPQVRHHRALAAFEGPLPDTSAAFRVRIEILDWDFVDYPAITLLSDPDGFRPHVDDRGGLCYAGPGSILFDRHDPVGNLRTCLAAAAQELNRQVMPGYRHDESRYEFARYWSQTVFALVGTIRPDRRLHRTYFSQVDSKRPLIADDPAEIEAIRRSLIFGKEGRTGDEHVNRAWVISLEVDPWLDRRGPPDSWAALWAWIEMVDPRGADCLRSLVDLREFAEAETATIVFRYGSTCFGLITQISPGDRESRALAKFKRGGRSGLASYLKDYAGANIAVLPFEAMDVSGRFIHQRSLRTGETLGGLRINLIGAGAIGGFVAQQLVRLGAGSGGGDLRIVDPDALRAENIGRHLLGMDMLLQPKAIAVTAFLLRQFPLSSIHAEVNDARRVEGLFDCDLLIDATGEEGLSLVLNEIHQERMTTDAPTPPMLFVWVLGNGEVVQGLLSDGGDHACYDCLNLPGKTGLDRQRFPVLKALPETGFIGCRTMRPYAVTAPSVAAGLAVQMAIDWRSGRARPRFRSVYLGRGTHLYNIKSDADPQRLAGCSTCSRTSS